MSDDDTDRFLCRRIAHWIDCGLPVAEAKVRAYAELLDKRVAAELPGKFGGRPPGAAVNDNLPP